MENNENQIDLTTTAPGSEAGADEGSTTQAADTTTTPAPGAEGGAASNEPKSALEAALKVIDGKREQAERDAGTQRDGQQTAAADQGGKVPPSGNEGDADFIPEGEYRKLDVRVQRRIGKLTEQTRVAREAVKAMEPRAKAYDDLNKYLQTSGLEQDEFTWTLALMRAVKQNPAEAWQMIQPLIGDLRGYVGEQFPEDIAKRVEAGTLSQEDAKELVLARNERARVERQLQERTQQHQQVEGQRQVTQFVEGVKSTITDWENRWKASDPDYAKKQPQVWAQMRLLMEERQQQTNNKFISAKDMIAICEQARKNVDGWIDGLLPRGREQRPVVGGTPNVQTNKNPGSALEAAQMGLQRARQAA